MTTTIYEKPVRFLMQDMVRDFNLQLGQVFDRQRAIDWFAQNYPKIKKGTINAHLIRLSINSPSRLHYKAKVGEDDCFFQLDGNRFRLYDVNQDPAPIHDANHRSVIQLEESLEQNEVEGSRSFAYESDLRDYLARNLQLVEPGLRLYEDDEITGIEFPAGGRLIDILAIDAQANLVVIELKVARAYDRVIGQLLRYIAWIQQNQTNPGQQVRGMIVSRTISDDLRLACSLLPDVTRLEYELAVAVKPVQ